MVLDQDMRAIEAAPHGGRLGLTIRHEGGQGGDARSVE
jgi:hypothetical protein